MKKSLFKNDVFWAFVTGILFSTSYPPFPGWALFFCFVPLWVTWYRAESLKTVFQTGFVAQFVFTLVGFNWIAHTAVEYGHIPFILSVLILIGFCLFASLNVVFAGALAFLIKRRYHFTPFWFFATVAVFSAAFEWIYPMIFPWNMGYPLLFNKLQTSQLAEFIGFNLLSVLVGLANACFSTASVNYPEKGWSRPILFFVIALIFTEGTGTFVESNLPKDDRVLHTLFVQPNIGNYDKYFAERGNGFQAPIVEKDFALTLKGINAASVKPDLIVWPETAYPADLDPYFQFQIYPKRLMDFAKQFQIPMIVGSYSEDPPGKDQKAYNAVFGVNEQGNILPGYRKNLLLAFGEYFPGAQYLPFLKKIVPEISDFGRGTGPSLLNLASTSFSPLICYEGLDTSFVNKAVRLGPQILVNVTNDSWFGNDFEPYQHMIMTIARTVEYRRPMIRATNTGVSVIADSHGSILGRGPQNEEWSHVLSLPYSSSPKTTFFSLIEPYLTLIFLALAALCVFMGKHFSEKRT